MEQSVGRKRTASGHAKPVALPTTTASATMDTLPDEILVQIFSEVEIISRSKAKRVCRRWRDLIRETGSLQTLIKVDARYLTPAALAMPERQPDYCKASMYPERVLHTIRQAMQNYPGTEMCPFTIHITDESNPDWPGTADSVGEGQRNMSLEVWQGGLGGYLLWHLKKPAYRKCTHLILEKINLPALELSWYLGHCCGGTTGRRVELRNTKVVDITLLDFDCTKDRIPGRQTAECRRERELTRWLDLSVTFDGKRVTRQDVDVISLLGRKEEMLSIDEQKQFRAAIAKCKFQQYPNHVVLDILTRILRRRPTWKEIASGDGLPPLVKRMFIAGKSDMVYWNFQASKEYHGR